MNLDELQSVQSRERQASSLQHLRSSFYEEAASYVGELRAERNQVAAASDNPFEDPEVERLSNEIKSAEGTVESIYERRVGKVVKLASIAAADMPYDDEGLTKEEEQLFGTLVDAIEGNRERVLSVLDGESPALDCTPAEGGEPTASETGSHPADPSGARDDADALDSGPGGSPADPSTPRDTSDPASAADTGPTAREDRPDVGGDEGRPSPPDRPVEGGEPDPTDGPTPTEAEPAPDPARATDGPADGDPLDIGSAMGGSDDPEPSSVEDQPPAPKATPGAEGHAAGAPGDGGEEGPEGDEPVERTMVRVTADVGNIFGIDGRSYDLSAEDVVTLPTSNAENLVSKDAAVRLD